MRPIWPQNPFTRPSESSNMDWPSPDDRAAIDAEFLLKIILVLIVALLALEVVDRFFNALFGAFRPVVSLVIILLIVLFLLDRL